MAIYRVKLKGISPLLMHRNSPEMDELLKRAKDNTAKMEIEKQNYHLYLHTDGDGKPVVPAIMLTRCFVNAAKDFQQKGKGKKTYKNIVGGGFVMILDDKIPINPPKYVRDEQYVKVQQHRVIRYRPRFDEWELTFRLYVDDSLSPNIVRDILQYSGLYVGLGDFRPERGGPYGRFKLEEFTKID